MIELEPLPHAEAIAYFRSKGFAPQLQRFHHLDHFREDHARQFVVAKAMRDDIAKLFRDELLSSLEQGRTLAQFQAALEPVLRREGWWGRSQMTDPLTGETQEVQLGSMRRLRTIYDTNMRTAHAAGHWARIQRTKTAFPYLQYIQIERPSKRHDHERFHDKIWRVDDPIWLRIYPPNGFFCGCHVVQRTEGWMRRNNRTVSDPIDLDEQPWTNKRTGEVTPVPKGVHPGFDTNPGATWLDIEARTDEVMPDLTPERRAYERGLLQGVRLRQTAIGRETLVVSDTAHELHVMGDAAPEHPDRVSVDDVFAGTAGFEPGQVDLLHSHLTDSPLSYDDLLTLANPQIRSVTAISPGGGIWRARTGAEILNPHFGGFARQAKPLLDAYSSGMQAEDRNHIVHHALGLYLERRGAIHYHYSLTGRLRDLFDEFADLIERLSS
ncbi:phage minor head protein [Salipiger abyssi]|uniref:Phage putative head morphogenesis protein, SPP1 gp7 family n=1 Tax=Salipiger abyssi TaxID=1250539 RepID=A0A1P8UXP3_9RHOB|nr:phage minor head protein [Salipiger abyssi]ALF02111.1 virion morphogenesis protein [Pelagibaca phage vB_PeaS-P1]APZ54126.1 phage putative head morphogenesis protein, SPP1 gp7 family [Salipiger abyssi]